MESPKTLRKMMRNRDYNIVGIIPTANQFSDYDFLWNGALMPISKDLYAIERSVAECVMAGCRSIWIVGSKKSSVAIKRIVGNWVADPINVMIGRKPSKKDNFWRNWFWWNTWRKKTKQSCYKIPIYYLDPKREDMKFCCFKSVMYGFETVLDFTKKLSSNVVPDVFYISFPFMVYPINQLAVHRTKISCLSPFYVEYKYKGMKSGKPMGFTLTRQHFDRYFTQYNKFLNKKKDVTKEPLPIDFFEKVLNMFTKVEYFHRPAWCYDISTWAGYQDFLSSEHSKKIKRPFFFSQQNQDSNLIIPPSTIENKETK